jgi:hypothetical protein
MAAVMPNIAYGRVGGIAVMVGGRENPSDEEWDRYVDFLEGMGTPGPVARTLAITMGGAPTSRQRAVLERRIGEKRKGSKLAVVTGSTFARGVLNGWALVRPGYRAFSPEKIAAAIHFLDISPAVAPEVEAMVAKLQAELGSPSHLGASPAR